MKRTVSALLALILILILAIPIAAQETRAKGRVLQLDAPAIAGEYVVKFRPGTSKASREAAAGRQGGRITAHNDALNLSTVEFSALRGKSQAQAASSVLNALAEDSNIEFIEPNYIYSVDFTPNDPQLSQQWAWSRVQAFQAWDVTQGSSSVVISIIDTGITAGHQDLSGKIVAGRDFIDGDTNPADGHGHGTHVAGTTAAKTNNGVGVAGFCPNCSLQGVRVLGNTGSGSNAGIAQGITWAADNGAKVINLSLGGTAGSSALQQAVDYAWNRGVFLACAAGNSNTTAPSYPAYYGNCFAVASTTNTDARSSFSNYGSWVEIAAPGSNIYSTLSSGGYGNMSGTSMASPHVAGLAGLLASQGLSNAQIRDRLCSTADRIAGTGSQWTCGRINAYRAVSGGGTLPTATRTRTNTTGTGPTATRTRTNTPGGTNPTATRTRTATQGSGAYPAWAPNVSYSVGTRVSYAGVNYQCLQSHTSLTGWEPPNTPALWQRI